MHMRGHAMTGGGLTDGQTVTLAFRLGFGAGGHRGAAGGCEHYFAALRDPSQTQTKLSLAATILLDFGSPYCKRRWPKQQTQEAQAAIRRAEGPVSIAAAD